MTQDRARLGLGKLLVITQVALSLVLLAGAGLLVGTFRKLATLDPGFDRDRVLIVNMDFRNVNDPQERRAAIFQEILDRVKSMPDVRSATISNNTPISGNGWNGGLVVDGFTPRGPRDSMAWFYESFPGYFETLGMKLVAGRDFDDRDRAGSQKVAVVNETLVRKFFKGANPIGKTYRERGAGTTLDPPVEIIGIVKDAKYRTLREDAPPTAYLAMRQNSKLGVYASIGVRTTGPATSLIAGLKAELENVSRDITLEFRTLAVQVDESLTRERLLATISGFFGAVGLLLASIGLYGVMSYNVARRRGEIGIRMALGAEQSRVLRMVLGEVALLVAIGLAIGAGVALASTRLVSTFLYGITPRDPLTLAVAAAVLASVAAFAGYLPARRASRLDPMVALREE
jgi:putative ABC transport system permease protein